MRPVVLLCCAAALGVVAMRADLAQVVDGGSATASDVDKPRPLLVVLHGNNETAEQRADHWREAIERRGWSLLALDCPDELGCDEMGRWYAWNGDPSWLRERVRAHAEHERIDMSRVYLAGWSGGATYIGKNVRAWQTMFAGLVFHGGGVPPTDDTCPSRPVPAYFLVGDENPTHGATRRLRDYFQRCDEDVRWDLIPGANHLEEDAALTPEKVDEILRWLEVHRAANPVS